MFHGNKVHIYNVSWQYSTYIRFMVIALICDVLWKFSAVISRIYTMFHGNTEHIFDVPWQQRIYRMFHDSVVQIKDVSL